MAATTTAVILGVLIAFAPPPALVTAVLPLVPLSLLVRRRLPTHGRIVGSVQARAILALWFTLASTLVWRVRASDAVAGNPLDAAGTYRVGMLAVAALLALSCIYERGVALEGVPMAARLYALYALVVPLGALMAVQPALVVFRFIDLAVFVLVWYAAHRAFDRDHSVPLRHLKFFMLAAVATVVVGVALFPTEALPAVRGGLLSWRLQGVVPAFSANSVGTFGVFLAAYGLVKASRSWPMLAIGVVLVLVTQYRTGYVALLLMVVLALWLRRDWLSKFALLGVVPGAWLAWTSDLAQKAWARGESPELLAALTGRTNWWELAIETAARSRIVGIGLTSGTRFEVFAKSLGRQETSTIHSTWVEAFSGTGFLGLALLLAAFLVAGVAAWRSAASGGSTLPMMLLAALAVRSITGSTVELAGLGTLLFLAAVSQATSPRMHGAGNRRRIGQPLSYAGSSGTGKVGAPRRQAYVDSALDAAEERVRPYAINIG